MTLRIESVENRRVEVRAGQSTDRVSLVTGGTDGIGRAVAIELARRGDRVLFVGRDPARGAEVLSALHALAPGVDHAFLRADLSLLSETARVAETVRLVTPRLDSVVFCAGILSTVPEWTAENLERNLVLNYLTRFLLARALMPLVERARSGRIVLVSNAGKYKDLLDFDDLQHRRGKPGLAVAGRTQFANDLLAVELAERLRGTRIQVACVFPGVTRSSFLRNARGLPAFVRFLAPLVVRFFGHRPEIAARTPVFLAQDERASSTNGLFFGPNCTPLAVPERARRPERRAVLWSASEEMVRPYELESVRPTKGDGVPGRRIERHK